MQTPPVRISVLDSRVLFHEQVIDIVMKAFAQIHFGNLLHSFLDQDVLFMLTHALVTSQLDYCNRLYIDLS